jgi:hypothetical protein
MGGSAVTRAARTALALALTLSIGAATEAAEFRTRTEFGLNGAWGDATSHEAALGFSAMHNLTASARLMWEGGEDAVRFAFHANVIGVHGDAPGYLIAQMTSPFVAYAPPPPATLFNLTAVNLLDPRTALVGNIDRAWVSFSTDNLVVKLGRQAITWGGGLVFHPSDIVAPFSPDAIDTSYKPGVDMLYAQYLFDNGADIQAIAVPRAAAFGGPVTTAQSTYALRASMSAGAFDGALMLARDRGDKVASLGLAGPLGEASWNAEYIHWVLAGGAVHPSWLINVSNFTTLGDWNVQYFAEYYHNGFGVAPTVAVDALPASLTKRMSTGQVFLAGRDFLALGGLIQTTPDLSFAPNVFISLTDGSALASLGVNYTLGDNTDLSFNYFHPLGPDGSDFGGRETSTGSGVFVGLSRAATIRLVHYF